MNLDLSNEELLKKIRDPKFYLENFCKIKSKDSGLIPFILNEPQKDLFNTIRDNNRVMVLKSRQIGISTAVIGYFYHYTIMHPGITAAIIGYNADLTSELLDKVKTFHKSTPKELRPTTHFDSKNEMSFPSIDSKIIVLPSTKEVGRGYTIHLCLCTEFAMWDNDEEKMSSLEASVPISGKIIIETTPKGRSNNYYVKWKAKDNGYIKKKYGWQWVYSEEEIEVIKKRINNPLIFAQEYDCDFISSGRTVFNQEKVEEQKKNILKLGDIVKRPDGDIFKVYEKDDLRIYRDPEKEGFYVISADTSEGIEGGDFTAVIVWNRLTGEEVAMYHGLVAPDVLAGMLSKWGRLYNNALCIVESNYTGLPTLIALKNLLYPNIYFRPAKFDTITSQMSERMGWRTSAVTRPILINDFVKALADNEVIIHSEELLDEMETFYYDNNNNMVSGSSKHDDLIFAAGIGIQGWKMISRKPMTQIDYKNILPKNFSY